MGIIPADAGSTGINSACQIDGWDHPRGCGEHVSTNMPTLISAGSSPRMRGAPDSLCQPIPGIGIIPADAGSTDEAQELRADYADHPRGCGEHLFQYSVAARRVGSSPRMRGAPHDHASGVVQNRIIPADAGSTRDKWLMVSASRDHPRGCGEHCRDWMGLKMLQRIIPADAGSTSRRVRQSFDIRDHPRGCGEHLLTWLVSLRRSGSSPRMRGAPSDDRRRLCEGRIIPADAGSTTWQSAPRSHPGDHPRGCGEHTRKSTMMCLK